MRLLQKVSIKRKQTLIILLTSGVALLLACAGFATCELLTFRRAMVQQLSTLAEVIGNNSTGALDFNDPKSAEEALSALKAESGIRGAVIYGRRGEVFASYDRTADGETFLPPTNRPAGFQFKPNALLLSQPIVSKGETIGAVYVESDLRALYSRLEQYALIVLGVFSAASLVAFLLSTWLQRVISGPILHLVQVARAVAENNNFSLRAQKQSQDELGVLVDGFNEMLAQIQHRDSELQKANDELEARVAERTQELQQEVSERRHAEAASRASEEKFRALAETANDAIISADGRGCIIYWNRAAVRLFGYTSAEAIGQSLALIMPERLQAAPQTGFQKFLTSGETKALGQTEEMSGRKKDGGEFPLELSLATWEMDGQRFFTGFIHDITQRKRAEAKLEEAHKQLLETSRRAGMAEVATGVLHNVGNVLNSVNVSATLVSDTVKKSRATNLGRVAALLDEHAADLGRFLTSDPRGRELPRYLSQLAEHLSAGQSSMLTELESLRKNVEHIKEIVAMQQSYAKVAGVMEIVQVTDLVEDTLRLNAAALARHRVTVIRDYAEVPPLALERHKVLQILVNLVRNAKYACDESGRPDKQVTVRVTNGDGRVRIAVIDNGVGIPPENLTLIFNHGFTTRKDGHGFGLHSGALAAREMGGSLHVHSDGAGKGARFTLELPCDRKEQNL